jgi:transcriptional regulator with PAS, ATPase and Fis domain
VTGNPLFDDDKDIALVVTSVRDITELVELKDKLHERTLEVNRYLAELDHIKTLQGQNKTFITKNKKVLEIMEIAVKAAQLDSSI